MTLKTLKDLKADLHKEENRDNVQHIAFTQMFIDNELKTEIVKWVKEDKVRISKMTKEYQTPSRVILRKWMFRLNITEKDLDALPKQGVTNE